MSFIKSLVKELDVAKSMLNIPQLKTDKERLLVKIQVTNNKIDMLNKTIANKDNIINTVKLLRDCKMYFTEEDLQRDDLQTKSTEVADTMEKSLNNCQANLEHETQKLSKLLAELEQVNKELKKARDNVK